MSFARGNPSGITDKELNNGNPSGIADKEFC